MSGFLGVVARFAESKGKQAADVFGLVRRGLAGEPEAMEELRKDWDVYGPSLRFYGAVGGEHPFEIRLGTEEERRKAGQAFSTWLNLRFYEGCPKRWAEMANPHVKAFNRGGGK